MELKQLLTELGFAAIVEHSRFDAFGGTSVASTAAKFGVYGANVSAVKPA